MNRRRVKKNPAIESLVARHGEMKKLIRSRLEDFRHIEPQEYFYELLYCLMTPQSSAVHADAVVETLKGLDFEHHSFDVEPHLREPRHYIRFHKAKTRNIEKAKMQIAEIVATVTNGISAEEKRGWLVKNVLGLGLKEASHFLRNVGRNEGLTILDRHILRNLKRYGVIRSLPKTLTRKKYLAIERRFKKFADEVGIPVDELDLLFWSGETGEIRK